MEPSARNHLLTTYLEKVSPGDYTLRLHEPTAIAPVIFHKSSLFPCCARVAFLSYQDQQTCNLLKKYLKKHGWISASFKAREIIAEFFKENQTTLVSSRLEEVVFRNPLKTQPIYLKYKESFAEEDPSLNNKIETGGEWYLGEQKIFFRTKLLNAGYREERLKLAGVKIKESSPVLKNGYLYSCSKHHNHFVYTLTDTTSRIISMITVCLFPNHSVFLFNAFTSITERGKGYMKDLVQYTLSKLYQEGFTHAFTILPFDISLQGAEIVWSFYKYSKPRSLLQSKTEAVQDKRREVK